jgi:hypothetical protein
MTSRRDELEAAAREPDGFVRLANGSLRRPDGKPAFAIAKVFVGTGTPFDDTGNELAAFTGTSIPTSANPVGDYTTILQFGGTLRDDLGLVDSVNHRIYIPDAYRECRITYNLAWGVAGTSTFTCTTTSGSAKLTSVSSTAVLAIGAPVSGTGVPAGAVIMGISGTDVWINMPATANGSGITVTVTNAAVGFRGMRVKNGSAKNYGNVRIPSIAAANTTTNNNYTSPWIAIVDTDSPGNAPNRIANGDYLSFWPAQTSGAAQLAGADFASSFVQLEVR